MNPELVTATSYRRLAVAAEESGFYGVCLDEHPAPVGSWLEAGGHHCLDPFVGLAAVAGVTTTLRLATYLSILPYHQPFAFTKAATSLDFMSDGRLILGVGVGYLKGEFEALGVDFERRNERFMETVDVFRRACTGQPVSYQGSSFSADEVVILPAAVQRPHPPIWLGGNSRLTRRRVVEFGQGWMPMPMRRLPGDYHKTPPLENADDLQELLKEMHDYAEQIGRTDPTLRGVVGTPRAGVHGLRVVRPIRSTATDRRSWHICSDRA
jgi:probable F420-dependent oxidoreductase